jgi:hypothetical protein
MFGRLFENLPSDALVPLATLLRAIASELERRALVLAQDRHLNDTATRRRQVAQERMLELIEAGAPDVVIRNALRSVHLEPLVVQAWIAQARRLQSTERIGSDVTKRKTTLAKPQPATAQGPIAAKIPLPAS